MITDDKKEQVVRLCKDGDSAAWLELIESCSGRMLSYFIANVRNRSVAEDLLSDFYIKLYKSIDGYKGGSFEAWLYKIAYSVFCDYLRKTMRERENVQQYHEEMAHLQDAGEAEEELPDVVSALDGLDEESRSLVMLRYYSDMSFKEIAEVTGKPIGTVLTKVHRALKKLKTKLIIE
ncbi:MAG: RNA polymerase sigma factor [Phycisphaerae bacterium]